jgi:hypothetical protein
VNLWAVEAHGEVVTPIEALRAIGSINAKRGLVAQSENPSKKDGDISALNCVTIAGLHGRKAI